VHKKISELKVFVIILCISSCFSSNEIYFDIENQSVVSCNHKGIRRLYIENLTNSEVYRIEFNNENGGILPNRVFIDSISTAYLVFLDWHKKPIPSAKFKLAPLARYKVERAQGDASAFGIDIWTEENGKVYKSTNESCLD
jgi:hypothetical protein